MSLITVQTADILATETSIDRRPFKAWFGKRSFNRPIRLTNPTPHALKRQAQFIAPFSERLATPLVFKKSLYSTVIDLNIMSCPTTIIRLVVAIYINAVKAQTFFRRIAHVSVKVFKRVSPARANGDATAAVIFVGRVFRIIAAGSHSNPSGMNLSTALFMFVVSRSSIDCIETATALNVSASQGTSANASGVSATTFAKPNKNAGLRSVNQSSYRQKSELLASDIFKITTPPMCWVRKKLNVRIDVGHFANSPKTWISNLARLGSVLVAPFRAASILPIPCSNINKIGGFQCL